MAQPSQRLTQLVTGAVSTAARARKLAKALAEAGAADTDGVESLVLQPLVSRGFSSDEARAVSKACLSEEEGASAAAAAPAKAKAVKRAPAPAPASPRDEPEADTPPRKRQRSIAAAFARGGSGTGAAKAEASTDGVAAADLPAVWREHHDGSLLTMNEDEVAPSAKVAGFDMDGCLIETRSGRAFPTGKDDWQLRFPGKLEARMRALHSDGYKLVVRGRCCGGRCRCHPRPPLSPLSAPVSASAGATGQPFHPVTTFRCPRRCSPTSWALRRGKRRRPIFAPKSLPCPAPSASPCRRSWPPTSPASASLRPEWCAASPLAAAGGRWSDAFLSRVKQWAHFVECCNRPAGSDKAVAVDLEASLFVGDAAGRAADKSRRVKKDHSASDYKFALNAGIPFHTPEAFFGNSRLPRDTDASRWTLGFDPSQMRAWADRPVFPSLPHGAAAGSPLRAADGEPPRLVVLTGPPGSGKSAVARGQLAHCERVNQDTLKTAARCEKAARAALDEGRSVVIDATNRDRKTRARWTKLAAEYGARAVAVWMDVPLEAAFHGNAYRAVAPGDGPDTGRRVPDMIMYAFRKQFEMPTEAEGFADVVRAQLVPGPFESDEHERLFFSYVM